MTYQFSYKEIADVSIAYFDVIDAKTKLLRTDEQHPANSVEVQNAIEHLQKCLGDYRKATPIEVREILHKQGNLSVDALEDLCKRLEKRTIECATK